MMMNKEVFDKYFKLDFLSLVGDRVINVRIMMAKALVHHFLKEIMGTFIADQEFNEAVWVLKQDECEEVKYLVSEIELQYPDEKYKDVTLDSFLAKMKDMRNNSSRSDTDSMNSEDESRIENEVRRHNSEDEIDHGPVLRSIRAANSLKEQEEEE